jgi:hypothetical protein
MIQRWLGLLLLRRAYTLLVADDPRPLRARLTREAKRIVLAALVIAALIVAVCVAAVVALVVYLT